MYVGCHVCRQDMTRSSVLVTPACNAHSLGGSACVSYISLGLCVTCHSCVKYAVKERTL